MYKRIYTSSEQYKDSIFFVLYCDFEENFRWTATSQTQTNPLMVNGENVSMAQ